MPVAYAGEHLQLLKGLPNDVLNAALQYAMFDTPERGALDRSGFGIEENSANVRLAQQIFDGLSRSSYDPAQTPPERIDTSLSSTGRDSVAHILANRFETNFSLRDVLGKTADFVRMSREIADVQHIDNMLREVPAANRDDVERTLLNFLQTADPMNELTTARTIAGNVIQGLPQRAFDTVQQSLRGYVQSLPGRLSVRDDAAIRLLDLYTTNTGPNAEEQPYTREPLRPVGTGALKQRPSPRTAPAVPNPGPLDDESAFGTAAPRELQNSIHIVFDRLGERVADVVDAALSHMLAKYNTDSQPLRNSLRALLYSVNEGHVPPNARAIAQTLLESTGTHLGSFLREFVPVVEKAQRDADEAFARRLASPLKQDTLHQGPSALRGQPNLVVSNAILTELSRTGTPTIAGITAALQAVLPANFSNEPVIGLNRDRTRANEMAKQIVEYLTQGGREQAMVALLNPPVRYDIGRNATPLLYPEPTAAPKAETSIAFIAAMTEDQVIKMGSDEKWLSTLSPEEFDAFGKKLEEL